MKFLSHFSSIQLYLGSMICFAVAHYSRNQMAIYSVMLILGITLLVLGFKNRTRK
ncbi:hypothetical protein FLBR109950_05320 [Flavobacterium branchiophilum]|uniref:hypothetical protein n=1 Tax=Flavobacterium branchiophilum TaxID=55197 RepID=UPI0002DB32B3|nr:hypothetical protein [Flavobacterium branchiophilum]